MQRLWVAAFVFAAAGAAGAGAPTGAVLDERVNALAAELRCVVCQNQSLADSQADIARDMKREVRAQLAAGRSEAQVVDFMVQRYGDFVRYRPALQPNTWLLWAGPLIALIAGALVLARRLRLRDEDEDAAQEHSPSPVGAASAAIGDTPRAHRG